MTSAALVALLLTGPVGAGGAGAAVGDAVHPNRGASEIMEQTWQQDPDRDRTNPVPTGWLGAGAGPDSLGWPSARAIEARVRSVIGGRWDVAPAGLVLEWGVVDVPWIPDRDAEITVAGSGAGGWWSVHFHHPLEERPDFALRVRAGLSAEVPVAARSLDRGVPLAPEDIAWTEAPVWGAPGDAGEPLVQPGWVTRRVLRKGELLAPPAVEAPVLVRGGEEVEIIWMRGAISLRLRGRAVQSGSLGERVRVRTESGHRLVGVVDGPNRVVILENREAVA